MPIESETSLHFLHDVVPKSERYHVSGFSAGLVLQFFTSVTLVSQAYP